MFDKSQKPVTSACYDKQHVCAYLQPCSRYTQWRSYRGFRRFNEPGPPSSWGPPSQATKKIKQENNRHTSKKQLIAQYCSILRSLAHLKLTSHDVKLIELFMDCLLYTSPSPRDRQKSRMPSSA